MQLAVVVVALLPAMANIALAFGIKETSDYHTDAGAAGLLKRMLEKYDRRLRPNLTGPPTMVRIDLSIVSFGHIEEVRMIFPCELFFRQRWNDPRLKHDLSRPLTLMAGRKHVSDIIWVPDTVFVNSIDSKMHDVTVKNDKIDIHPNGDVFWGTRISVRASCRLDLESYPMDTQRCSIGMKSYAYPSDDIVYKWHKKPGIKILDPETPQYDLLDYGTEATFDTNDAGNYSILNTMFTFKRRTGYAILQIYIPTIAIVCVSWISLWIDQDSATPRILLCITTLLTLSTICASVNSTLPRVSYIKAVDLFLLVSFCFVFFTLVQYILVLNLSARAKANRKAEACREREENSNEKFGLNDETADKGNEIIEASERNVHCPGSKAYENLRQRVKFSKEAKSQNCLVFRKVKGPETSNLDKIGRVVFPFGYIMFNMYYWIEYLGSNELKKFPH